MKYKRKREKNWWNSLVKNSTITGNLLPILLLVLLATACSEERKPKMAYSEEEQVEEISRDSLGRMMSDLPIQIDSTKYLIHPVGQYRLYERESRYFGSSSSGSGSYSLTWNNSSDTYTGTFSNLKFQYLEFEALTALTDKNLRISSFSFLRAIFNSTSTLIQQHWKWRNIYRLETLD